MTALYAPLAKITTSAEADDFITERIVALREAGLPAEASAQAGDERSNEELDALERAQVIAWFAVWDLHNHQRIAALFSAQPNSTLETRHSKLS